MGRTPCCDKNGLKKGPWTPEEDKKLVDYIHKHGYGNWRTLPKIAGLERCGKSCRLRWTNYLRPDIKRGRFSFEEEETIIQLHCILGNKWSAIAARLPGRTDNEIKNYWNTHIRKRLLRMGIDPVTHSPRLDLLDLSSILGNTTHMNMMPRLLGLQPKVNSELIKLATSLFSTAHNPNLSCFMTQQFSPNAQIQNGLDPWVQTTQIEAPIVTTMSNHTTMTTTGTATRLNPSAPIIKEETRTNFDQYPSNNNLSSFVDQNFDQWQTQKFLPSAQVLEYYGGIEPPFMDPLGSVNSNFESNSTRVEGEQTSFTPSSNPSVEDRDSYCSEDMLMINKFEIPDFLDINQFILTPNNC